MVNNENRIYLFYYESELTKKEDFYLNNFEVSEFND